MEKIRFPEPVFSLHDMYEDEKFMKNKCNEKNFKLAIKALRKIQNHAKANKRYLVSDIDAIMELTRSTLHTIFLD